MANDQRPLTCKLEECMDAIQKLDFDALIIGGGIAGLQAALDLADQDYKVAIVEKATSIGGKMIKLSKVFPTLDCLKDPGILMHCVSLPHRSPHIIP